MSRFSSPPDGRHFRPRHVWEEDGTNSSTDCSSVKEEGYAAICMTWRLSQISALKLENHLQGLPVQVLATRLPHLSSLVSLRVCNQHVDEILAQTLVVGLQANRSVKRVSLQGCQFVVPGTAATPSSGSTVSTLSQQPCPAWSIFVAGVVKAQQLEVLELDSCSLTCRHVVDLENALAGRLSKSVDNASGSVCRLKRLGLNGNHLASLDSVLALSDMLQREDSQLQSLDLDGCLWYPPLLVSAPNLSPLFRTLSQSNTALQRLNLSSNGLQDDNLVRLANYLRCKTRSLSSSPCSLVYLDLSHNGICLGYGVTEFCKALAVNTSIQTLLLDYNYLNVDALLTLAFNLQGNSTLRNLNLEGNDAFSSNTAAKALVPAVQFGLYRIVTSRPDPPWSDFYDNHLQWHTHLNWAGRHLVQGNHQYCRENSMDDAQQQHHEEGSVARAGSGPVSIPIGLWPIILARVNQKCDGRYHNRKHIPSVLYFLLHRGPVLLERPSAFAVL